MWTTSAPLIAAVSTSLTGLAKSVCWRCANQLAIGTESSGTQYISGPDPVGLPSPHATTRTVCPRAIRASANRNADTAVPLLPTLNVSVTSVMIICPPPLPDPPPTHPTTPVPPRPPFPPPAPVPPSARSCICGHDRARWESPTSRSRRYAAGVRDGAHDLVRDPRLRGASPLGGVRPEPSG